MRKENRETVAAFYKNVRKKRNDEKRPRKTITKVGLKGAHRM